MLLQAGTRVVVEAEAVGRQPRTGTVREVVRREPSPRYVIEWDDGRTTTYTPAAGALRVLDREPAGRT